MAWLALVVAPDREAEHRRFVDTVSHDLNEPLRMVASFAELLEKRSGGALDERGLTYLNYLVDGARRMQDMLAALLALARVASRGNPLEPCDGQRALESALRRHDQEIRERGAQVTWDELPRVLADEEQVAQLFGYLVHNSLVFHGDAPPRIHIGCARTDDGYRFSVADHGPGVAAGYLDAVFTVFRQLQGRGDVPGAGCGAGLAIARAIVHRHGGRIWLESEPESGATVYFTLQPAP